MSNRFVKNWRKLLYVPLFLFAVDGLAQKKKPKLVVGIVVDQMRQEFLDRFKDDFGKEGFNRMLAEGFELKNAHYNYLPTTTGPGHASVFTGTTPAFHGIVYNNWYSRKAESKLYCVEDSGVSMVGATGESGKRSPKNLVTTTVTDELKIATQFRSKVVSVSVKDRSAILGGGHNPDGAYWYDGKSGNFVTSTYYGQELPAWVNEFNGRKLPKMYAKKEWKPILPMSAYNESRQDGAEYEQGLHGTEFPYKASHMHGKKGNRITDTPYGNDLLTEMAMASVLGEKLGKGNETDFLAISYSSTDKIGHAYGPASVEIQDTYIRLDRNIAELLSFLDKQVGQGEYVVFLTADHAASEAPGYLEEHKMPGGYFDQNGMEEALESFLSQKYGAGKWLDYVDFFQLYFNPETLEKHGLDRRNVSRVVADWLLDWEGVARTFTAKEANLADYNGGGYKGMLSRGFYPKRSGDVFYLMNSGWLVRDSGKGTSHGAIYAYDTHVPILWFGADIPHGSSVKYHRITDVAPTVSLMLGIKLPSGSTGEPISEILEEDKTGGAVK
ncbi:alkaline phosphatase family protein [Fulvitalea axinellae]|uniref:Alkaline phosphatase family protein n=1 Tax=Fulvitalea axinellae TaxID=1182444 RepID=A0AAU9CB71_9BACT|nr:alkaline phosphatase family protein [Fulvitalea axinellae]